MPFIVHFQNMKDFEKNSLTYKEEAKLFNDYFTTGYLPSIQDKFVIIDLIGWIVYELRKKKPDVTFYQITHKLAEGTGLNEDEIKKWAILAEDFSYQCKDFMDCGLKITEAPKKVKELFGKILPF